MIDRKGITDRVSLNGMTLMNWQIYLLPFDGSYMNNLKFLSTENVRPGIFFKGDFKLSVTGDTYIDVSKWKKGIVWVNGHNLGRYWEIGPQKRLYCPAPWLKEGKNEIIFFDIHGLNAQSVKGVRTLND
jgi:beta-galactosidase GanA